MFGAKDGLAFADRIGGVSMQLAISGVEQRAVDTFLNQRVRESVISPLWPHQIAGDQCVAAVLGVLSEEAQRVQSEALADNRSGLKRHFVTWPEPVHAGQARTLVGTRPPSQPAFLPL